MAALAYKCINRNARKRPSMRDIVQTLSRIIKLRCSRKHHRKGLPISMEEVSIDIDQSEAHAPTADHQRGESIDSIKDPRDY